MAHRLSSSRHPHEWRNNTSLPPPPHTHTNTHTFNLRRQLKAQDAAVGKLRDMLAQADERFDSAQAEAALKLHAAQVWLLFALFHSSMLGGL